MCFFQWCCAPANAIGHPQPRILTKPIRIILIPPTLSQQQKVRAQQFRQPIRDQFGLARIVKALGQPVDDPAAFHDL